ncbi:hypothetical protein KKH36_02455 [Patescibacteria group bacterium]|nr:hypothetical protein [Patescibacteria group bacterium]
MGIRFERVLEQAKVLVVNTHKSGGTFVRMEVTKVIIPSTREFKTVWADVHAGWMKVSESSGTNKSVIEVILGMSEKTFRTRFPEASLAADNQKLHEKFKNQRFQKPDFGNRNTWQSPKYYRGRMYA